ncbi:hypothetical protein [Streptomyces sp900129855]|uniref:TetR family transcriptional regulator n=1 Tax=Streptomyces sp. 900129855 TaxID=3155129 RepID=A0ABV2ZZE5_9ACTN
MKRALPDADTVKAAIDTVLEEAATRGHRPTVTAVERHLGIPHATFHRHYADLIDTRFRPHIPATAPPVVQAESSGADERREANLARLRKENTELRRTLTLYEEAIRKLALENEALRTGATVIPLQARFRRTSQPLLNRDPWEGKAQRARQGVVRSRRVIVAARGRTAIPSDGGAPARATATLTDRGPDGMTNVSIAACLDEDFARRRNHRGRGACRGWAGTCASSPAPR